MVACEEAQEKGGTFNYGYLFLAFPMLKWTPPTRRPLVLVYKGRLAIFFDPWHSREDSEKTTFNKTTLSKWYNKLIDATQRLCISKELVNYNTRNITFNMNPHHTFVCPRYANREDFHLWMLPFYLDEDSFEKEVMSWP